jgi:hypothetical protein
MGLELKSGNVDGLYVHFLAFSDGDLVLQENIHEILVNSVTQDKSRLKAWKQKSTRIIYSKRGCKQDAKKLFAVSLGMRFYPKSSWKSAFLY